MKTAEDGTSSGNDALRMHEHYWNHMVLVFTIWVKNPGLKRQPDRM